MTPEAQRMAIARACPEVASIEPSGLWCKYDMGRPFDPLNDLNAMHEAEKVLTHDQLQQYVDQLNRLRQDGWGNKHIDAYCCTAAQRAEAFLRTLGKWEDDK